MAAAEQKNQWWLLSKGPLLYSHHRLLEEAGHLDIELVNKQLNEFSLIYPLSEKFPLNHKPKMILSRFLGNHFDDFDLDLLNYFESQGISCVNSSQSIAKARSKLLQSKIFFQNQIPSLPLISFRGPLSFERQNEMSKFFTDQLHKWDLKFDHQYVLKFERGHQGKGVILVKGQDSLISVWESFESLGDQRMVVTPFIGGADIRELRAFFINHKLQLLLERFPAEGDFRANFSVKKKNIEITDGALARVLQPEEISDQVLSVALKTIKSFGLYIGTVDLFVLPQNRPVIIEVNATPGLEEAESVSGLNLGREILLSIQANFR